MVQLALLAVCAVVPLVLFLGRNYAGVVVAIVIAGALQAPLISWTHDTAFLVEDDVMVVVLVALTLSTALGSRARSDRRVWAIFGITLPLVALAVVRSPSLSVGVAQARQVLEPVGLVLVGMCLRDRIRWTTVLRFVLAAAIVAALWAHLEFLLQRPLMDATWYYIHAIGGSEYSLREGIPPAYIADLGYGVTTFRPGGPFMNPPTLGFFLGLGAYAAMRVVGNVYLRLLCLALIGTALFEAYARAGLIIFVLVTFMYVLWIRGTRPVIAVGGAIVALYVARQFIAQGNTASHAQGLLDGILTGLKAPLGEGFGSSGYQALLAGATGPKAAAGAESLFGLYAAWLGWPALLGLGWVLWLLARRLVRVQRASAIPYWLSLGFAAAAALSESAASMAATPVLWLVLGTVIAAPAPNDPVLTSRSGHRVRTTRRPQPAGRPLAATR